MKTETTVTLTISLDKDFFKFLRQKNCLRQYVKNVENYMKYVEMSGSPRRFFDSLEKEGTVNTPLYSAFGWAGCPEGYKFWSDLAGEWFKQCLPEWESRSGNPRVITHWVDVEAWEEVFTAEKLLAGKRYCVRDNSWNRPAYLTTWQKDVWDFFDPESGWLDLVTLCPREGLLILSDYPVKKTLVNGPGGKNYPEKFVKVLLPNGRPWWVIYNENWVIYNEDSVL